MPQNFDWDVMRNGIEMVEQDGTDLLDEDGEDSYEGIQKALKCVPLPLCMACHRYRGLYEGQTVCMYAHKIMGKSYRYVPGNLLENNWSIYAAYRCVTSVEAHPCCLEQLCRDRMSNSI